MTLRGEALDEHLLRASADLFYVEGIGSTGMDRVAEVTGVTKKTIYRRHASKDALVAASLDLVSGERLALLLRGTVEVAEPRDRLVAVFDGLAALSADAGFRGCPYLSAAAQTSRDHPVHAVARRYKDATRAWFTATAAQAGIGEPVRLAIQLTTLLDGVLTELALLDPGDVLPAACAAARTLVNAAARSAHHTRAGGAT